MPKVDTVLLKVASRCNIDCAYCYVYHLGDFGWSRQPKRMSLETCSAVADKLHELAFSRVNSSQWCCMEASLYFLARMV